MAIRLETALADVVDNSITAKAYRIEILTDLDARGLSIGILDNGTGMAEEELLEAMRPAAEIRAMSEIRQTLAASALGSRRHLFRNAAASPSLRAPKESRRRGDLGPGLCCRQG